jgi:hypothetical protein
MIEEIMLNGTRQISTWYRNVELLKTYIELNIKHLLQILLFHHITKFILFIFFYFGNDFFLLLPYIFAVVHVIDLGRTWEGLI